MCSSMSCVRWLIYKIFILTVIVQDAQSEPQELVIPPYHELSKQTYKLDSDGLFGFSIAYQKQMKSLVVGSPLDRTIGKVYTCGIKERLNCTQVTSNLPVMNFKNNDTSWLGATVNAGDDFFMACAPRFVETITETNEPGTKGKCYYYKKVTPEHGNFTQMSTISIVELKEYHRTTYIKSHRRDETIDKTDKTESLMDSFGWSSYIKGNKILVGGPAMSIGRTIMYPNYTGSPVLLPVNNTDLEKTKRDLFNNFGYSMTSGAFLDPKENWFAISSPYGTIGYGRIYFYEDGDESLTMGAMWVDGMRDTRIGSLFGASLASLLCKDNRAALLVGAPAFTKDTDNSDYDNGAVYIYRFTKEEVQIHAILIKTLKGDKIGGYFGASITCVGDFDGDGIEEVAIAAPYEDNGRGAVYIYSGQKLLDGGIDASVSHLQMILPENNIPNQLFGWSLTAPQDADENGCNELAIGAPGANSITLLRCIASVNIDLNAIFPDNFEKQNQELTVDDSSFDLKSCFQVFYNDKLDLKKITTDVQLSTEIIHRDASILGVSGNVKSINASLSSIKNNIFCDENLKIKLPKKANYDQQILFNISVKLNQNPLEMHEFNPHLVLLSGKTSALFKPSSTIKGSNLTFHIDSTLTDEYMIGSTESETLNVTIHNSGNTAHGACARIKRIKGVTMPKDTTCSFADEWLKCIRPIMTAENQTWSIGLNMKSLTSSNESLRIYVEVLANECKKPIAQKPYNTTFNLKKDTNIIIKKVSTPGFTVNTTLQELKMGMGKSIGHTYSITNLGVTKWKNLSCELTLPTKLKVESVTVKYVSGNSAKTFCVVKKDKAYCTIEELPTNNWAQVTVTMEIQKESSLAEQIKTLGKETVDTELQLKLTSTDILISNITTVVTLWHAKEVPVWMIIVAALVGLVVLIILFWALHECGFLKRKNKEKLEEIKEEVKRITMRKSIMLRNSTIEVIRNEMKNDVNNENTHTNNHDKKRLLSVQEEDGVSNDGDLEMVVHHCKEIQHNDDDPARAAFNAELAKALAKGGQTGVTKVDVH